MRHGSLSIPYAYGGDAIVYGVLIKAIVTQGWYLTNDFLGMPDGMRIHDFAMPMPDSFHFLLIKIAGFFTSDFARILNLFFLINFPITTICTLYVLRRFNISYAPAILASLLYTFLHYHLSRSEHHLMLSAYYTVPLIVMVMLWLCTGQLSLTGTERGQERLHLRNPRLLLSIVLCLIVGSTGGGYYSFFACALLFSVGLFLALQRNSFRSALLPLILIGVIFSTLVLCLAPHLIYTSRHGKVEVGQRKAAESEIYGLKIVQILLPIDGHRLESFARLKERYNKDSPLVTENHTAALGVIGSLGFLQLLGWLLYRRSFRPGDSENREPELLDHLSLLNASALLVATIGGLGTLFAHYVSSQIRCYNRMSVYIAFFAFFTVALSLDRLSRRHFQTRPRQIVFHIGVVIMILLGVLDQSQKRSLQDFASLREEFQSDREFMGRIEAAVAPGAMIFQLPVHTFPEGESYDHFKGYLHSNTLKWTFGAMPGRPAIQWQKSAAAKPPKEMVETLITAGFRGIYIDRKAYLDRGAKIESDLSALLGEQPLVSPNERLIFFRLPAQGQFSVSEAPRIRASNTAFLTTGKGDAPIRLHVSPIDSIEVALVNGERVSSTPDPGKGELEVVIPAVLRANPGALSVQVRTAAGRPSMPYQIVVASKGSVNSVPLTTIDGSRYEKSVAPQTLAASFGTKLASQAATPTRVQLPISLDGTSVYINGVAAKLYYVSEHQINYLIPPDTASGPAHVVVVAKDGTLSHGTATVVMASPGI